MHSYEDGGRYTMPAAGMTRNIAHPGYKVVGRLMHGFVEEFYRDAMPWSNYSTDEFFDYVENIPYVLDANVWGVGKETLTRPARFNELSGLDCKKKAIFVACWARCKGISYNFIAVDDTGQGITHVFCEVEETPGNWITMDCTLPGLFRPGSPMPNVKYAEVI